MFHTTHIHVPRNRRPSALRTFIASSSFGPPDTKEPLRRGILLTTVALVMLLIGGMLTWLGFNDVFGGRMSMTGPLLIALSLLLLLLSCRQFLLARKRNTNNHSSMQLDPVNGETLTAVVVNRDNGLHPATIIVDRYNRMGYDNSVTVHRHSDDDCAPPSYHEVTQLSSSSNTPSCATHDGQDELPPTYEETMGSSIYSLHPLLPSFLHSLQENGGCMPSSPPSVAMVCGETERCGTGFTSTRVSERDAGQGHTSASIGGLFPSYTHKPSPLMMPTLPSLQLDTGAGLGRGVLAHSQHASVHPMMQQHSQHSLALPPQHMSAPASPRQLSAPPSPHPFSAPPSPRQLSPHQHPNTPLQYVSASSSPQQLSAPLSLHMLLAQSPPHGPSGPPPPTPFLPPPLPAPCQDSTVGPRRPSTRLLPLLRTSCPPHPPRMCCLLPHRLAFPRAHYLCIHHPLSLSFPLPLPWLLGPRATLPLTTLPHLPPSHTTAPSPGPLPRLQAAATKATRASRTTLSPPSPWRPPRQHPSFMATPPPSATLSETVPLAPPTLATQTV